MAFIVDGFAAGRVLVAGLPGTLPPSSSDSEDCEEDLRAVAASEAASSLDVDETTSHEAASVLMTATATSIPVLCAAERNTQFVVGSSGDATFAISKEVFERWSVDATKASADDE
jgi:hypothetical protein